MSWDPYAVLGLKKGADAAEVKKAYRKLAKENHPDVRPNDPAAEETFKRATAAFNLLSDPDKKALYDRGEIDAEGQEQATFRGNPFGGGGNPFGAGGNPFGGGQRRSYTYGQGSGEPGADGFEDLFSSLFGGGGQQKRRQATRGQDAKYVVDVDFIDAVTGAKRRLSMTDGKVLDVTIPAGIESGKKLRLRSQGHPGTGGAPPGDAILEVRLKDHPDFVRKGKDIYTKLPISIVEAIEGAKVDVNTPLGRKTLSVPAGANSGGKLRMRGQGVQLSDGPGDLYVELRVTLPEKPNSELKNFLKTWSQRDETPKR